MFPCLSKKRKINYFHFHCRISSTLFISRFVNILGVNIPKQFWDYEGDDVIAALRKFTRGERIALLGESRFPEQFLADNTCARCRVGPDRSERDVGRSAGSILLDLLRDLSARRDATGRDVLVAGEATIRLTQNFEYCSNFPDRIPRIVAVAIRSLARSHRRERDRDCESRMEKWERGMTERTWKGLRRPLCMGNGIPLFPFLSFSLGERDRFSFNTPTPTYASARPDLPGGHDE